MTLHNLSLPVTKLGIGKEDPCLWSYVRQNYHEIPLDAIPNLGTTADYFIRNSNIDGGAKLFVG